MLGLTATLPEDEEYLQFMNNVAPVVYTKQFKDVEGQNVVSEYQIFNIPVKLTGKDNAKYRIFNKNFARAQMELNILKKKRPYLREHSVFDLARIYSTSTDKDDLTKWAKQFWSSMTMRKWVCYNAIDKAIATKKIVDLFPDRK